MTPFRFYNGVRIEGRSEMHKRYFRAELDWVFGVCARCRQTKDRVTRVPHTRKRGRYCRACLGRKKRLLAERAA